ncbi:MAG: histidine kinase [Gaiellaceae bacterium]
MATAVAPPIASRARPQHAVVVAALAFIGAAATVLVALHVGDAPLRAPDRYSALRALAVALYVTVGSYTSWRRPGARFGFYLTGSGLVFSVATLTASHHQLPHTIGRVVFGAFSVALAYIFLVFPHDRLASRLERGVIAGLAIASAALWLVTIPLVPELPAAGPLTDCSPGCPGNAFQLTEAGADTLAVLADVTTVVVGAGLIAVAGLLFYKSRAPARLRRRLVGPLLLCASVQAAVYAVFSIMREFGTTPPELLRNVGIAASLALPLAMLVGQVRGNVMAATSLRQLVVRVGGSTVTPVRAEEILRRALGDPLLRFALWDTSRQTYVDVEGAPIELPHDDAAVNVTLVERDGRHTAALIHDASLADSGVAESLAATSVLLIENAGLVEELQGSRRRIVKTAQDERLRLERNLHDGAQQRLFSVQIKLEAAREHAADPQLAAELDEIAGDAAAAVAELRSLAHGIYPTILRERGLVDALSAVARSSAIGVSVTSQRVERMSSEVEEAIYFCVCEAVQNAAKHAGDEARVSVGLENHASFFEALVEDDGCGFDAREGADSSGLVGIRDRIGAVGGDVEITSHVGVGTSVRLLVPRG